MTPIPIRLEWPAALSERVAPSVVRSSVEGELGALLHELGLPGTPDFALAATSATDYVRPLTLTVDGRERPYPAATLEAIHAYVTDSHPQGDFAPLPALSDLGADALTQFMRLFCRAVISTAPSALLTSEIAATYREALTAHGDATALPEVDALRAILEPVLDLRIGLADRAAVAHVLETTYAPQRSAAETSEALIAALRPPTVEVQLPADYLRELTLHADAEDQSAFTLMREGLFYELGVHYPPIELVPNDALQPRSFQLKINDLTTVPQRGLAPDECLINESAERMEMAGLDAQAVTDPVYQRDFAIVDKKSASQWNGATTWSPVGYLVLAASARLRAHSACFLDRPAVETHLRDLSETFPRLVEMVEAEITPTRLAPVLRLLIAEQVSIRNLRQILQAILDFDVIVSDPASLIIFDSRYVAPHPPSDAWLADPVPLASAIRIALSRSISYQHTRGHHTLVVYLLDPETVEQPLSTPEARDFTTARAALSDGDRRRILRAVRAELNDSIPSTPPPAILTTEDVRPHLRQLIQHEFPKTPVLAYRELEPDLNIQPIGRISA